VSGAHRGDAGGLVRRALTLVAAIGSAHGARPRRASAPRSVASLGVGCAPICDQIHMRLQG
jgi:hypothetical protein